MRRISCVLACIGLLAVAFGAAGCVSGMLGRTAVFNDGTSSAAVPAQALLYRCRETVVRSARPYGLVQLAARSAGPARVESAGAIAPMFVTAVYARQGGPETRSALVLCRFDETGDVVALN